KESGYVIKVLRFDRVYLFNCSPTRNIKGQTPQEAWSGVKPRKIQVFKIKTNAKEKVEKYKAKLVAKGYKQQHGVDYDEVFAPVARMEMIRLLISRAAQMDFKKVMSCKFEMAEIGLMSYYLGLEVKQMNDDIFVSQESYANKLRMWLQLLHMSSYLVKKIIEGV
ncbi:hypothetical protein CR513_37006, partial [Mucuna pruriens]